MENCQCEPKLDGLAVLAEHPAIVVLAYLIVIFPWGIMQNVDFISELYLREMAYRSPYATPWVFALGFLDCSATIYLILCASPTYLGRLQRNDDGCCRHTHEHISHEKNDLGFVTAQRVPCMVHRFDGEIGEARIDFSVQMEIDATLR